MFNWKYANYLVCKLVNSLHISIIIQLAFTIHNITSKRPSVYTMHAVNREFSLQYYFCNFQGKIHTRKYWTAVNIFFKEHHKPSEENLWILNSAEVSRFTVHGKKGVFWNDWNMNAQLLLQGHSEWVVAFHVGEAISSSIKVICMIW